jgi:polyribonucleotide nucleotidyltransferase
VEQTGVKIDIEDDGTVAIASVDEAAAKRAMDIIGKIVEVPEVGKVYLGKVVKIMEFGAFVEILPGTDGLLHISQIPRSASSAWRMSEGARSREGIGGPARSG